MKKAILTLILYVLGGCVSQTLPSDNTETFFPFAARPSESITLKHDVQVVKGDVFHFQQDGSRVTHHLASVGTKSNSNTYVVSVSSPLDVADFMSPDFDAEDDVAAIISIAETYCAKTGYTRVGSGVQIWIGATTSSLVEFCVPKGIKLPPSYKAGDRVPRTN